MRHSFEIALHADHEDLPYRLEELSEGLVRAAIGEIEAAESPDDFPCCCQCGGFSMDVGDPSTYRPRRGYISPRDILRSKTGDALSLCVYQVAQARREGKDARVVCEWGTTRDTVQPLVEIDGEIKDLVSELSAQECGCAGGEH